MRVTELLTKDTIAMDLMANDKNGVIDELVNQLDKAGKLTDVASFKEAIHNRESQSTTGIGEGIAIPHAKVAAVKSPAIAFGKSKEGVDYQSLDMQPAHLFFMIAAPEGGAQTHLDALAKLSGILMDENVREKLLHASSPEEVLAIIDHADDEATKEEEAEAEAQQVAAVEANQDTNGSNEPYVLAVTACPTGIAHTYMARDALKKQADKMGIKIKVETNGSSGIKNHLTEQDIKNATGIIVAADVHVETDRFDGKNVVEVPVADGIKRPEELINKALDTSRKPFVARDGQRKGNSNDSQEKLSPGKAFYKHLMNGVSNMLPLVISGGILMAIVFLFGANSFDPKSSEYNAFAEQLWNIGSKSAFALIIPILSGFIARSIADKPGFASGLVGGMLAISGGSGFIGGIIAGFLAYIPFELSLLLRLFKPNKKYEWPLFIIYSFIFVLLLPNTFYMVTDLIHLNQFQFNFYAGLNLGEWKYFTYLLLGVFLAVYVMILIYFEILTLTSHRWLNRLIVFVLMFLNGFGIYIGRFLRLHSVYFFNEPLHVLNHILESLTLKTAMFVCFMVVMQAAILLFGKGVRLNK